ncbi:Non-specific serine/threonine protein kinase [Bertholletia excelsa]
MASVPSFLPFLVLSPLFLPYSAAYNKTNEDACPPCFHCESRRERSTTSIECVFRPVCCGDSREPPNTNHSQTEKWCHVEKCSSDPNKDNRTSPRPLQGQPVSFKSCRHSNDHEDPRFNDLHPKTPTCPPLPPQLALYTCHNNSNQANPFRDYSANTFYECYPCDDFHYHLRSPFNWSIVGLYCGNEDGFSVLGEEQSLQFNRSSEIFDCCPEGVDGCHAPPPIANPELGHGNAKGDSSVITGALVVLIIFCLLLWRCKNWKSVPSPLLSRNTSSDPPSRPIGESSFYFGMPVFTYSELEEATNYFHTSYELGDGGFGTVYHGKLQDGREVAVKRLHERNCRRISQFLNEIQILSQLRHPNLVSLYGCTSRQSQELLLVYEYIPNGTVADHLHGDRANSGSLTWPIRMNIAIETASALAYLHASQVIHLDVKTTNLLLDHDFSVKVADFGLARLFPFNASHVSTAPQGTPGYVDPEYYHSYRLTDKSDVYSFGVVLVELISSRPAVDMGRQKHEISLVNFAMSRIQNHAVNELIDPGLGFGSDTSVERMTTSVAEVAFRCLQPEGEMRPTMDEVLEALKQIREYRETETAPQEGDAELLKVPPNSLTAVTNGGVSISISND